LWTSTAPFEVSKVESKVLRALRIGSTFENRHCERQHCTLSRGLVERGAGVFEAVVTEVTVDNVQHHQERMSAIRNRWGLGWAGLTLTEIQPDGLVR